MMTNKEKLFNLPTKTLVLKLNLNRLYCENCIAYDFCHNNTDKHSAKNYGCSDIITSFLDSEVEENE